MDIKCIDVCKRELSPGVTQSYPKGWSGDVPDKIALKWIREGKAARITSVSAVVEVPAPASSGGDIDAPNGDEDVDPETGEIQSVDEVAGASSDLAAMTVAELRLIASERRIAGFARMNKAALVAALSA